MLTVCVLVLAAYGFRINGAVAPAHPVLVCSATAIEFVIVVMVLCHAVVGAVGV